ncbi:hypothetical protein WUBG_15893, partial [Wuchereria bancrofti]
MSLHHLEKTAFSAIGEERKESLVVRKAGQDSKAASFPRGMDHLLELLIIHSPTFYHHHNCLSRLEICIDLN